VLCLAKSSHDHHCCDRFIFDDENSHTRLVSTHGSSLDPRAGGRDTRSSD
jgi:hypothetical protein